MWSSAFLLVVLVMLAFVQGLPKEINQYRTKNLEPIHSPKRQTSSLLLGGRFGRSCFLRAGGCLGKRAKPWEVLQISPEDLSDLSADTINDISPSSVRQLDINAMDKVENQKIGLGFQRVPGFNPPEGKLQRTLDLDYPTYYLQ
ncbi:uncharacterized protein LOC126737941 isoform X4 [Anthonomus grandis grandis]|uniref:uncharacterized protein LOC126737941 isoform X4 n=1 Tax=Anthonomus grandis grandis TaxID=2921223 RepID=UPI00216634EE|nr:uncharacterized protein LOC126737941 isoform X4 [Anthonomus grandis grandis]